MYKICVIEVGEFLLGIDTSSIVSIRDMDTFISDKQEDNPSLFHLASFLSKQSLPIPEGDKVVIEVKNDKEIFTILVANRVIGKIETPSHFEPLPLLYPDLASKCCPHVFLHDEQVVLLLDVVEFIATAENMENAHGILSLNDFVAGITETEQESKADSDKRQPDITVSSPENKPSADLQGANIPEAKTDPPKTKMDETQFNKIVIWTIDTFIHCDKSEPVVVTMDMMPPELIQQQGSNDERVQIVIDETITNCVKLNKKILHLLRTQATNMGS